MEKSAGGCAEEMDAEVRIDADAPTAEPPSDGEEDRHTDPEQPQSDASGEETSSGSERQRRLESFELLDAAMDNVVDDDGHGGDDHNAIVDVDGREVVPLGAANDAAHVVSAGGDTVDERTMEILDESLGHGAVVKELKPSSDAANAQALVDAESAALETNLADVNAREVADLPVPSEAASNTSSGSVVPAEMPPLAHEVVSGFEKYEPELLQWMLECQNNNHGLPASQDDVLFFMETKYPELLGNVAALFEWLTPFLAIYNQMLPTRVGESTDMADPDASLGKQLDRFSDEFKLSAIQQLEETGDLTAVANEFGLKSTTTLVYWKYQREDAGQVLATRGGAGEHGRKVGFTHEQYLLEWVLSHRETPITKQDIFNHMISAYPKFATTKTAAALKMWIARFLKRHLSPGIATSKDLLSALPVVEGLETDTETGLPDSTTDTRVRDTVAAETSQAFGSKLPVAPSIPATTAPPQPKRREKRGCPEGYVLHSNEFKLNALRKLDEGKTISEVTEELGLKSQNTLAYWNSIRDKLATSEKKRFRLAGGGRRSSCTFEDELLTWVTDRHQKGEGAETMDSKKSGRRSSSSASGAANAIEQLVMQQQQPSLIDRLHPHRDTWSKKSNVSHARHVYAPSVAAVGAKPNQTNDRAAKKLGALPLESTVPPCETPRDAASVQAKRALRNAISVSDFESKYGKDDVMMRYVLQVLCGKSSVRRQDIPKGKSTRFLCEEACDDLEEHTCAFVLTSVLLFILLLIAANALRKIHPEEDVLYLKYDTCPPCGFRNAYWLQFTDETEVVQGERDYFTLGSLGFTHFHNSAVTEFVDIVDWVDEKRAFDHMTMMKGLERIQQMLFFFSWRKKTIKAKHRRAQAQLACRLFTCHPIAAQILLNVRAVCNEIEEHAKKHQIQRNTTYTSEKFITIQRARMHAAKLFVTSKTATICDFISREMQQLHAPPSRERRCSISSSSAFTSSLQVSSFRERMFSFLRLVDLHVSESIFRHLELFLLDLYAQVCGAAATAEPQCRLLQKRRSSVSSALSPIPPESIATTHMTYLEVPDAEKSEIGRDEPIEFEIRYQLKDAQPLFPVLYARLEEDIDFEADAQSCRLDITPTKTNVYELLHGTIGDYMSGLDEIPSVSMDARFSHVLTPFSPHHRSNFYGSLGKPSGSVLESYGDKLRDMRHAVETYFRQLEVLKTEHLHCIDAIQDAETAFVRKNYQDEELLRNGGDFAALDTIGAQHYEEAQNAWGEFLSYAKEAPPFVQIGFLLVDQRHLITKILWHASKRTDEMDQALPGLYKLFLKDLLREIDGRIEKVTKIPTNFEDANVWLSQVIEMMPSHPFRQKFDAKCENLARLQGLLRERGTPSFDSEGHEGVRKLELEWETTFETLMVCLGRVQDRDSEHRRSFYDLTTKTDEYIHAELGLVRKDFRDIPMSLNKPSDGSENPSTSKKREKELSVQKSEIVQRAEKLVALDFERQSVATQFRMYEREYRAIVEQQQCEAREVLSIDTLKLPSELLLQQVVTALDLRKWFESWNGLVMKWEHSPLSSIHPGMIMDRVRQFRRRLMCASSRLFGHPGSETHLPTGEQSEETSFLAKDLELVQIFDQSIEQMTKDCRIFQAVSGSAFTEERWKAVDQMLHSLPSVDWKNNSRNNLTLSVLKDQWGVQFPEQMDLFLGLCDQVIVESKVHTKVTQARQRLTQLKMLFFEENYSVRCANTQETLVELEDLLLGAKLFLHEQNPELDVLLSFCGDIESKILICEQIQLFQSKWFYVCEMTKLHDADEYFTNRKASSQAKPGDSSGKTNVDDAQWLSLKNASQAWSDRMRRAFCNNASNLSDTLLENSRERSNANMSEKVRSNHPHDTPEPSYCSLDEIVEAFDGFDFDHSSASCESGMQLLSDYFTSLRELVPHLFLLSDAELLQLLVREDDINQIRHSLSICFPDVDTFTIGHTDKRTDFSSALPPSTATGGGSVRDSSTPDEANDSGSGDAQQHSSGSIVIRGIGCKHASMRAEFNSEVLKIGRVKFWFSRLEEEMAALVSSNLRSAVQSLLGEGKAGPISVAFVGKKMCQTMLPQAIVLASILRFSVHMDQAMLHCQNQQPHTEQAKASAVFDELKSQTEQSIADLIAALKHPPSGLRRGDPRIESVLLLCSHQARSLHRVVELLQLGQGENAVLFWKMQLKIRVCQENSKPTAKAAKSDMDTKVRGLRFGEALSVAGSDSSSLSGISFYAQVAHVELLVGHEYVGCNRLATVTPFTERCIYAILSAMKAHSMALVVPYTPKKHLQGQFSLLSAVAQVLMRASISFHGGAEVQNLHTIGHLLKATHALDGILTVHRFMHLPSSLRSACQDMFVQTYHQCISRHHQGGAGVSRSASTMSAAVLIPLVGEADLRTSGLLDSLQSPFRAVAIVLPSISYFTEALLLVEGFTTLQIAKMGVALFFESFAAAECELSPVSASYDLAATVVREARRVRNSYRAAFDSSVRCNSLPSRRGSSSDAIPVIAHDQFNVAIEQSIFKNAVKKIVSPILTQMTNESLIGRHRMLLEKSFPLASSCRMEIDNLKGGAREDDLAEALPICLEHSDYACCEAQCQTSMEIWRAIQKYHGIVVYGPPGSGKTTCIKTLHHALCALEFAGMQAGASESAEHESSPSVGDSNTNRASFIVLNPNLFSLEELYGQTPDASKPCDNVGLLTKILSASSHTRSRDRDASPHRIWVLVDGVHSSAGLEPLLGLLPGSDRWLHLLDGSSVKTDHDVLDSFRLIFEVADLSDMSPLALASCWSVYVPLKSVSHKDIIRAWRGSWERRNVFPAESRGFQNMGTAFRALELLVSTICAKFVAEEMSRAESSPDNSSRENDSSRLGLLSMNQMTQTALRLVTSLCFEHRGNLEEFSSTQMSSLVCFSVMWGFSGHLNDTMKHKLEHSIRSQAKGFAELRHLCDLPGSIFNGEHLGNVWGMLQPIQYRPGLPAVGEATGSSSESISEHIVYDPFSKQFLVVAPPLRTLVRICSSLIRSSHSFLFTGSSATGKTSLLRLLRRMNEEDEAAQEMIDASLDQRHAHGILNWLQMPPSWFRPTLAALDASGARSKFKEEAELFASRATYSFIFIDDLGSNVSGNAEPQEEFVRLLLDHRVAFSRKEGRFMALDKEIGAAMRVDDTAATTEHCAPALIRLMRHFIVLQVPNYDRKQLLSIFKIKYRSYFQSRAAPSAQDGTQSSSQHHGGERFLSIEETALRASVDLAVELSAIQQAVRGADIADIAVFTFNLHHVSALLGRTLAFGASMDVSEAGTTLLSLGKLHQAWMSEVRNLFLVNYSSWDKKPGLDKSRGDSPRGQSAPAQSEPIRKVWSALRLISEKYFSVSLREETRVLASIEVVYFTLRLAAKYSQLPVVEQLASLRETMATNASASFSTTRSRKNPNQKSELATREATTETIQRILLQLASSSSWPSSSPPARSYKTEDLSTLEVKLLMGSSFGLNKTLHLLHALDEQSHLIISAHDSRSIAECLLRFACDTHGLQVKRISSELDPQAQDETLRTILHAAVIQNERMALWIDSEAIGLEKALRVREPSALFELIRELVLNQIPSLLFRSGALRDAAILSFVQNQSKLEMANERDILNEFSDRVQRNLRLCLFIDVEGARGSRPSATAPASQLSVLLEWMNTRERFQWFCIEKVQHLDGVMIETAEVAIDLIERVPTAHTSETDAVSDSTLVSLCHQIHMELTASMVVKMSECVQLTYYLSFLKNLVVLHDRKRKEWERNVAQRQTMLKTLQSVHGFAKVLDTRRCALEGLVVRLTRAHKIATEEAETHRLALREEEATRDRDGGDGREDVFIARKNDTSWVHRSACEEIALRIAEAGTELDRIAEVLTTWTDVAAIEHDTVQKWERDLEKMRSSSTRTKLVVDSLLQSALVAYSYVASLSKSKLDACIAGIKDILSALGGQSDLTAPTAAVEDAKSFIVDDGMESPDGDSERNLVRMLWTARFRFLRHHSVVDTVCLADNICDRLPVFVDQSGILQRYFIHFFSGHSLFSSPSDAKEPIWRDASHAAMIIMCGDEKLEVKLQEAQRRNVPVLLINFQLRSTLPKLLPFLEYVSGHKRQPVFSRITKQSYDAHLAEREARRTRKHQPSLDPTAAASSGVDGALKAVSLGVMDDKAKPARKKFGMSALSNSVAAAAVASAASAVPKSDENAGLHATPSTAETINRHRLQGTGFQLYAVTATPIPIQDQHELAMNLAIFSATWSPKALEAFFHEAWVRKCNFKLHQEMQDRASTRVESVHRRLQLEKQLWESLVADPMAASVKSSSIPWVLELFQHYHAVPQRLTDLDEDQRRHRAEKRLVHGRSEEIRKETQKYAWIANQFVGIAASMTAVSALAGTSSQLYARSYRWLEYAIERQLDLLAARDHSIRRLELLDDQGELARSVVTEIVQQLVSGFASKSHRQIFLFLLTVERAAQRSEQHRHAVDRQGYRTAYELAVRLLSSSTGARGARTMEGEGRPGFLTPSPTAVAAGGQQRDEVAGTSAQGARPKTQSSMADRLRRKIRLCAFVFDDLAKSTRPRDSAGRKTGASGARVGIGNVNPMRRSGKRKSADPDTMASSHREQEFNARATSFLNELLTSVEVLWGEWKQGKVQVKMDLQRVLSSLGIRRSRLQRRQSVAVSDALTQAPNMIALVDRDDMYGDYSVTSVGREVEASDPKAFEKQMGRLLITKMHFSDAFADAMDEYIQDQTAVGDRAMISIKVPLPLTHSLLPREANRGLSSSAAALIGDVAPSRVHERVHLPNCIVTYDLRKRNRAGVLLSSWMQTASRTATVRFCDDGASLRERITTLVTSKDKFVVEILVADHFERLVSLVSHLINQHTVLSPPEWYILASLPVACSIQSCLLPLIPKSVIVRRAHSEISELGSDIKRWLVERGVSESFAGEWMECEFPDGDHSDTCDGMEDTFPILGDLRDLAVHLKAIEETHSDEGERRRLLKTLIELTSKKKSHLGSFPGRTRQSTDHGSKIAHTANCAVVAHANRILDHPDDWRIHSAEKSGECTKSRTASVNSSAAYSAELLGDLLLLRRSMTYANPDIMDVPENATPSTQGSEPIVARVEEEELGIRIPESLARLCDQIGYLYTMLQEELATRVALTSELASCFFPWQSLADEFETHFRAFAKVHSCYQVLNAATQKQTSAFLSIDTQQQLTSLANGLIPFDWMLLAFTNTVGPSTSISIAQLLLLVTCRLDMLVHCFGAEPLVAINLAVLSDPRGFLKKMKHHCAAKWNTSVENVILVLEIEPKDDDTPGSPSAVNETGKPTRQQQRPESLCDKGRCPSSMDAAMVRDTRGVPCGFRVDGLVVIEQSDSVVKPQQTNLHPLPLCRLYCAQLDEILRAEKKESEGQSTDSGTAWRHDREIPLPVVYTVKTLPLVMLPSLSPYQQPPQLEAKDEDSHENDAMLDPFVRLRFSLPAVVPALVVPRQDQTVVRVGIGAPMFPDDDDPEIG